MIHFLQVTPYKCISPSGRKISPTTQASYVTGLPVLNQDTGRTTHRRHTDGTEIIYADIVSCNENKYTDKGRTLAENLSAMAYDLYHAQRQNNENTWQELENAIPNYFTDEESRELARNIGYALSKKWKRPLIVGVHKKDGNIHLHILVPGRELAPDGQWKNKRQKIYKDRQGNPIYDKIYKDADGHDIRQPLVPEGEEPIYDDNGVCTNQIKKAGRRQWDCSTHEGDVFSKHEVKRLHDEVDKIHNNYYAQHGIDDRVVRISTEVKAVLKKLKLRQFHYGKRASAHWKKQVTENNRRYHVVADYVGRNLEQIRLCRIDEEIIRVAEEENAERLHRLTEHDARLRAEIAEMDKDNPVPAYVETVLKPESVFIDNEILKAEQYQSDKEQICKQLMHCLAQGYRGTRHDIESLQEQRETPRNTATIALWNKNNKAIAGLYSAIKKYMNRNISSAAKAHARNLWRGMTGWQRWKSIQRIKGEKASAIYEAYLHLEDMPATINVPSIMPDNDGLSHAKTALQKTVRQWTSNMCSANHIPPTDLSVLHELSLTESAITSRSAEAPIPPNYTESNTDALKTYNAAIEEIARNEHNTNVLEQLLADKDKEREKLVLTIAKNDKDYADYLRGLNDKVLISQYATNAGADSRPYAKAKSAYNKQLRDMGKEAPNKSASRNTINKPELKR